MDQYLGVGVVGGEAVALAFELLAQAVVVVDFAVEDEPHLAVLVAHRLSAAAQVHDGQAAEGQADSRAA